MASIELVLFQNPQILVHSSPHPLPYLKAEAILFYLAVEKKASREQLAALLWDSCDEASARKNLRHALYTVKQSLGDCICTEGRQTLCLNPDCFVKTDYERLMEDQDPDACRGEFLKGFYVKNALPFEEWMLEQRALTLRSYQALLRRRLLTLPTSEQEKADEIFDRLMAADSLDESACRMMMERCMAHGFYYKGIQLYRSLSKRMERELMASPGIDTVKLYETLLEAGSRDKPLLEELAAGLPELRNELSVLSEAYRRFLGGAPTALLLFCEEGCQKTRLTEGFVDALAERSIVPLQVSCRDTEQDILLKPFSGMVSQLKAQIEQRRFNADLSLLDSVSRLFPASGAVAGDDFHQILLLFHSVGAQTPLVLFFDDLHYCDLASLELLSLLIRERDPRLFLLLCVPPSELLHLSSILKPLVDEKLLLPLTLSPISSPQSAGQVTQESARQTSLQLFLEKSKKLTAEERSILELLSACQNGAGPEIFEDILELSPLRTLDALEHLKNLDLLTECSDRQPACFIYKNDSVRKNIYERMSSSRRCYYHRALAENLRQTEKFGPSDYECLIYHYSHAGKQSMEIKYRILALEEYARRNYELHPLHYPTQKTGAIHIPAFTGYCDILEDRLLSLPEKDAAAILCPRLYALLLRTKAQYCIAQGEYSTGLAVVKKALLINQQSVNEPLMKIRCLRLINFYRLNIWRIGDLEGSLSECLKLGREGGWEEDYAIDCRLYGLFQAMQGNYATSLRFLKQALRIFNQNPLKSRVYTLNIAGCYNYMGETYRKQKQFLRAVRFYEKAIQVCEAAHDSGNAVFYSNLGRAHLALGNKKESAAAFYLSNQRYDQTFALIGRSITKGYVSILEAEQGEFDSARALFTEAQKSAGLLASPNSLGFLYLAAGELKSRWAMEFASLLPESPAYYKRKAEAELREIPGVYEC